MKTELVYIAGPYSNPNPAIRQTHIAYAALWAMHYWKMGYPTICPHKNTANFDGGLSEKHFLKGDLEILKRCDIIVFIPGWNYSAGARIEHDYAVKHGKRLVIAGEEDLEKEEELLWD